MVVGRRPYFAPLLRRKSDEEFGELWIDGHDGGDHGLWRGKQDRRPRFAAQIHLDEQFRGAPCLRRRHVEPLQQLDRIDRLNHGERRRRLAI